MRDWLAGWIAAVQDLEIWSTPWAEVSRPAVAGWTAFYNSLQAQLPRATLLPDLADPALGALQMARRG